MCRRQQSDAASKNDLQEQLKSAELTGSMTRLREELEECKTATANTQVLQNAQQQAWQRVTLSLKAEHDKQVCQHQR